MRQPALKRFPTALLAAAIVVADQLTKSGAIDRLPEGSVEWLGGVVTFRGPHYNTGAAFSSLQGFGSAIAFLALGVAAFLWIAAGRSVIKPELYVFGLMMGGALGNAADRFFRGDGLADGAVVDFVDFAGIPLFNVADAAITVGVVLAILVSFLPLPSRPVGDPTVSPAADGAPLAEADGAVPA